MAKIKQKTNYMSSEKIFSAKNLKTIAIIAVIAIVLSLAFSFLETPKYKSSAKLLVVYNQENVDAYTASQTANYITGILSEVAYSSTFIDSVFKTDFDLKDNLGFSQEKRLSNWKKMVKVRTQENKGIITIDVLTGDKNQAEKFAQAIVYTLINKHTAYHGSGNKISLKIIESPAIAQKPSQPNFGKNTALGFIAGLILGFTFIFIFPEQKLFEFAFRAKKPFGSNDEIIELSEPMDYQTASEESYFEENE